MASKTNKKITHFMQSKKSKSKQPTDSNAPQKPLSSYFLFFEKRKAELRTTMPEVTPTQISKLTAMEWKAMSSNDKSTYHDLANDAQMAYELQLEEYKQTNHYKQHQQRVSEWRLSQCDQNNTNDHTNKAFKLHHIKGDLFSCASSYSLCHCISRDCVMGKGIAKLFKQKFGGVSELKHQSKKIGECGVLLRDKRFIYYLITKEKYWNKPTYMSLRQSLESMRHHARNNNVKHIAMPRIGCGLDKLVWSKVEDIVNDVFSDSHSSITVYSL
eukprot:538064_1